MENVFVLAGIISFVFFIAKFIEMRFIEKESKPFKILVRDTLLVYFCSIIAFFVFDQLKPMIQVEKNSVASAAAFTDTPGF